MTTWESLKPAAVIGGMCLLAGAFGAYLGYREVVHCDDYGAATGREIQMIHGVCYVRTGDHFVPRSEYGRQP